VIQMNPLVFGLTIMNSIE